MSFIDRHEGGERTLLVHVDFYLHDHPDALDEFKELARSAGSEVLNVITAKRTEPSAKYFVGKGKAQEIADAVKASGAEIVIFNHELTPAQERNLEKLFQCRVLDRTGLILDIFAQRAHTFEGKLQVELAQLKHLSTRLVRGWTHLERQKGGIGLRGPGETQLETDRRLLNSRIKAINKRLEKVVSQREQSRRGRRRASIPTVSLVGYTNAGKSTVFNRLTSSNVFAAHQLFATLDPTLRQLNLPGIGKVIIADTVGFVRDLPHDLVAAFRATLEETKQADLLLHVVDASSPHVKENLEAVSQVLKEIGADQVPELSIYNKIDLRKDTAPRVDYDEHDEPNRVWLSALSGAGFDLLTEAITTLLSDTIISCEVVLKSTEGKLRGQLYQLGVVKKETQTDDGLTHLQLKIQRVDYQRLLAHRSSCSN